MVAGASGPAHSLRIHEAVNYAAKGRTENRQQWWTLCGRLVKPDQLTEATGQPVTCGRCRWVRGRREARRRDLHYEEPDEPEGD